jgi:hypothetical protein
MRATSASNRGAVGAAAASCGWFRRTRPAFRPVGSTVPVGSVEARVGLLSHAASPSQPSTDAPVSRRRRRPTLVDRALRRPAAADRSVRAPRSSGFPCLGGPFRRAAHHSHPLPRAEAPSADGSLRADTWPTPRVRELPARNLPGFTQSRLARASGSQYYSQSGTESRHWCRGFGNPEPSVRHAFMGELAPTR